MIVLGIETSCDETAAAMVEETGDAERPWRVRSNVVASQVDIHREWGGVVPELSARQHIRDICGVVERALADGGRRRYDAIAVTRGLASSARCSSACRSPRRWPGRASVPLVPRASSGRPHRVARPRERRDAAAGRRARGLGRAHEPLPRAGARRATSCSAARATMRPGRRTTRWRSCSASGIRAGRSSIVSRRGQRPRDPVSEDAADARRSQRAAPAGPPRLQLQRAEDVGAAPRHRAARVAGPVAGRPAAGARRSRTSAPAFSAWSSRRCVDRLFDAAR